MGNSLVRTNAVGTIPSISTTQVSSIPERDSNGDSYANKWRADIALISAGGLAIGYANKIADYTCPSIPSDGLITVTVGSSNRTVTLPPAVTQAGQLVGVKRLDATEFTLTVDGNASETIDGNTSVYVNAQYETAWFLSDGSNWHEVMRHTPMSIAAKSASFAAYGARMFNITVGAGTITVTLPAASLMKYQVLTFKRVDTGIGSVTLTTNSTETIDGTNDPSGIFSGAGTQYDLLSIVSDGSNWHYLADRGPAT